MTCFQRRYQGKWRTIKRFREGHIRLLVNMKKLCSFAAPIKGDSLGSPKPNFHYLQDPQSYTVSRATSVLRGMANYYHLAESKRRCVSRILYLRCAQPLAKMFAAKYKLRTRAKVFKLGGRDVSKPLKVKKGIAPVGVTDQRIKGACATAGGSINGVGRRSRTPWPTICESLSHTNA